MRLLPRSREGRFAFGAVAVVVAVNLVTVAIDAFLPSPDGPPSSSFATAPRGMAAWAELLDRSGTEVRRLRERPSDATLPAEGTVVMLDPESFTRGQARALRRFAERGGRVVAGGAEPGDWLAELTGGDPPRWDDGGEPGARVLVPAPETGAAESLRTAEAGVWEDAGGALPLAAGDGRSDRRSSRRPAKAGSSCSRTRRRSRTGCSTRPTTPRWRSPWPGPARSPSSRPSTATARRPGSRRSPAASAGRSSCSPSAGWC